MSDVVISAFQFFPAATSGYSTTATTIRVWYSQSFLDSNGVAVQAGNGTTGFYLEADCTFASGVVTVPSLTIKATLDAENPNPSGIQCFARLFSNGTPKAMVFAGSGVPTGWVIPAITPTTYEDLNLYNQATVLANPPQTFWTAAQTQQYFASLDPAPDASDVVKGITKLSVAPAVATNPIAVGANDTAVLVTPASTADSKGVSAGTRASVADSKAVSDSILTSTAQSGVVSNSLNTSIADSKGVSGGTRASVADSKAVSDSLITSTAQSGVTSNSINVSTADSKGVSAGLRASLADSKAVSDSLLTSTADSKGTSAGLAASNATSAATSNSLKISTAQSGVTSNSLNISTAQSGVVSGSTGLSTLTSRVSSKGG